MRADLLVHARNDQRVPLDEERQLAPLIPGANLSVLESRNHFWLNHEPEWGLFHQRWRQMSTDPKDSLDSCPLSHSGGV